MTGVSFQRNQTTHFRGLLVLTQAHTQTCKDTAHKRTTRRTQTHTDSLSGRLVYNPADVNDEESMRMGCEGMKHASIVESVA